MTAAAAAQTDALSRERAALSVVVGAVPLNASMSPDPLAATRYYSGQFNANRTVWPTVDAMMSDVQAQASKLKVTVPGYGADAWITERLGPWALAPGSPAFGAHLFHFYAKTLGEAGLQILRQEPVFATNLQRFGGLHDAALVSVEDNDAPILVKDLPWFLGVYVTQSTGPAFLFVADRSFHLISPALLMRSKGMKPPINEMASVTTGLAVAIATGNAVVGVVVFAVTVIGMAVEASFNFEAWKGAARQDHQDYNVVLAQQQAEQRSNSLAGMLDKLRASALFIPAVAVVALGLLFTLARGRR